MTVIERYVKVYQDEKKTKLVPVRSFEISSVGWPKEKVYPVKLSMTGYPSLYLVCSHQGADIFTGFPISFRAWVKLKWHRLWHGLTQ